MKQFLFDLDDTLYDQRIPFEKAYQDHFGTTEPGLAQQVYAYSRIFSDEVFEQTQKQLMTIEEMHYYRLAKAFEKIGYKITREKALALQKDYAMNQREITLTTEMQMILTLCTQAGRRVGIITNGPGNHQKEKLEALGINQWVCSDHVFISEVLDMMKPDPRIFHYAQEQMALDPETTIYVGDSFSADVVGAKRAGWKVIWLNRRNHKTSDLAVQADYTVYSETALYQLIQQLIQEDAQKS